MKRKSIVYALFCGFLLVMAVLTSCGDSDDDSTPVIIEPTAVAGPDQNVTTGSIVTLDGSGSGGATDMTCAWSFTSLPTGSSAVLNGETGVNPTFTADKDGIYIIQLIVTSGGKTDIDSVTVTAATANSAPVASAGLDQNVLAGSTVTLDGSASSDADGDALSYSWASVSKPAGSSATLSNSATAKPR